jgi:hypothetical protein
MDMINRQVELHGKRPMSLEGVSVQRTTRKASHVLLTYTVPLLVTMILFTYAVYVVTKGNNTARICGTLWSIPAPAIERRLAMRVVQMCAIPETDISRAAVFIVSDEGRLYVKAISGLLPINEAPWLELTLPTAAECGAEPVQPTTAAGCNAV